MVDKEFGRKPRAIETPNLRRPNLMWLIPPEHDLLFMISQLTIGKKLVIGVTAFIACMAILSITSLWVISTLGNSLDSSINGTAKKLDLLSSTQLSFQHMRTVSQQQQVAYAIAELQRRSPNGAQWDCPACHMPSTVSDIQNQIQTSAADVKQHSGDLRALISDPAELKSLDILDQGSTQWVDSSKDYLRLADANHFEDAHATLRDKMFPVVEDTEKASAVLADSERTELQASNLQARANITRGRWIVSLLIAINLAVAGAVLWVIFEITSKLRQVAGEIGADADQTADAAAQVSSASKQLADGASVQAASLEETSASTTEINSMARKNTQSSGSAAELMTQTQDKFADSGLALQELVAAMGEINAQSGKIAKIIKVIDEIAFQSNILALNAAVEAARAGEAGLGFAVVAEEVRHLAQRSAQAATETAELVEQSIAKSADGKRKVDHMASTLEQITAQTAQAKTLVDEVNHGSQDQAREMDQVGKAILQMEHLTQQTAAAAQESATAAEELNAQSEALKGIVERLTAMVDGQPHNSRA
jgi:methyl-accepting chemotaxis protein